MKCNVGPGDRWFRILGGLLVIVVLGWFFKSWLALIGVVLLATGIFRFCPLYVPLKIDTTKKQNT
jgi:type IV secretory pathway TrbD component